MVHRHKDAPGSWFLTCYDLGITQKELSNHGLEEAKIEALENVQRKLASMAAYYKKLGVKL